jgi:hypothetical protein
MISAALRSTRLALTVHGEILALIVVCVHWPLDVLESFILYNWMDPESIRATLKVARAVDQFLRVIPDAALFWVISRTLNGESAGLRSSLAEGLRCYGRMWLTRFLGYLSLLSLLLLVVPGLYLLTRWGFSEATVVAEGRSGGSAFGRSWELTHGRFWNVLGAVLFGGAVYAAASALIVLAVTLAGDDNWWLDALSTMLSSVLRPLWMAYLFGLYRHLVDLHEPQAPPLPA